MEDSTLKKSLAIVSTAASLLVAPNQPGTAAPIGTESACAEPGGTCCPEVNAICIPDPENNPDIVLQDHLWVSGGGSCN